MTWKDCTSYSRNGDRTPRSWAISVGKFYMTITKGHIYHPNWWVVTCAPLALLTLEFEAARTALEAV